MKLISNLLDRVRGKQLADLDAVDAWDRETMGCGQALPRPHLPVDLAASEAMRKLVPTLEADAYVEEVRADCVRLGKRLNITVANCERWPISALIAFRVAAAQLAALNPSPRCDR